MMKNYAQWNNDTVIHKIIFNRCEGPTTSYYVQKNDNLYIISSYTKTINLGLATNGYGTKIRLTPVMWSVLMLNICYCFTALNMFQILVTLIILTECNNRSYGATYSIAKYIFI